MKTNKKKKGFTLIELIVVIVILAVISLIGIPAYNAIRKNVLETQYENTVSLVETEAAKFAYEKGTHLTNVQELIEAGFLESDDGKAIYDPRDKTLSLNCNLIEIEYKNGNYIANFLNEKNCNLAEAKAERSKIH